MKERSAKPNKYRAYTSKNIAQIPQFRSLTAEQRAAITAVSKVLPFRVNNYVVEQLIDWDNIPVDPMFQLTFPQEGMLDDDDFERIDGLLEREAPEGEIDQAVRDIRLSMNPHPGGQMDLNVPVIDGHPQAGIQHKYRETVLFFPSQGQTCHVYCTYCFRWAQFVGMDELKFANNDCASLVRYLRWSPEVRDVLFTGGDPMIMRTSVLRRYIKPLLKIETLKSIRIGTKALAWWPYRFTTDPDADDLLRLFEEVVAAGKHLAFMAHYSLPRELLTPVSEAAVKRIQATGVTIRAQAPLIRNVNDNADVWAAMWQKQVDLGIIPYYMFVERGHRTETVLPRAAPPRVRHLHSRYPPGFRPGTDREGTLHVVYAGKGVDRRHHRDQRTEGLRAEVHPGSGSALDEPRILRQVRRGGVLDRRPEAGVRGSFFLRGRVPDQPAMETLHGVFGRQEEGCQGGCGLAVEGLGQSVFALGAGTCRPFLLFGSEVRARPGCLRSEVASINKSKGLPRYFSAQPILRISSLSPRNTCWLRMRKPLSEIRLR